MHMYIYTNTHYFDSCQHICSIKFEREKNILSLETDNYFVWFKIIYYVCTDKNLYICMGQAWWFVPIILAF